MKESTKFFINDLNSHMGQVISKQILKFMEAPAEADGDEDVEMPKHEIFGTIRSGEEVPSFVNDQNVALTNDHKGEKIQQLLGNADVIVYDLAVFTTETLSALKSVASSNVESEKTFIALSNVMTWLKTKKPEPEDGEAQEEEEEMVKFNESDGDRRVPDRDAKFQLSAENIVLRKAGYEGRDKLSTYLVWSGFAYGGGEDLLHPLFKAAWHGTPEKLPVIGDGSNRVPFVHIGDLARLVLKIAEDKPEDQTVLAVDNGNATLKGAIEAIATHLGTGEVECLTQDEYLQRLQASSGDERALLESLKDLAKVDLSLESTNKGNLSFEEGTGLQYEDGLIACIGRVIEEYRVSRGVTPMTVLLSGPPASGKSELAKLIADEYEIPHISAAEVVKSVLESDDSKSKGAAAKGLVKPSAEQIGTILKEELTKRVCRNQGFVLDSFPENVDQAKALYPEPKEDGEEEEGGEPEEDGEGEDGPKKVKFEVRLAEFLLLPDAPDELLKERAMAMTEEEAGAENTEEAFTTRLKEYRDANVDEDSNIAAYFREKAIKVKESGEKGTNVVDLNAQSSLEDMMEIVRLSLGPPRNYHPDKKRLEREAAATAEAERAKKLAAEEESVEQTKEDEEMGKLKLDDKERAKKVLAAAEAAVEAKSRPLRKYLMETVIPVLTKGLVEVSRVRPNDPIDYLAEYLLKFD
uniref:Adenylate kinase n=1 Tax=Palpitomonas bilix TaxID=652834 RepID=A0A7S3DGZ1_9EUKA|mmetsp:Transcript_35092/g.91041  ORF Transcript_35092/g.91041 Transcript_35092/m.91041 type:complete len:693 (+) Transcript_35092:758-2836(+)